jgi:protein TonB
MALGYPERAYRMGIEGTATVRCTVKSNGSLYDCAITNEAPEQQGFGVAATKVAQRFVRAKPPLSGGEPSVDVTLAWKAH